MNRNFYENGSPVKDVNVKVSPAPEIVDPKGQNWEFNFKCNGNVT